MRLNATLLFTVVLLFCNTVKAQQSEKKYVLQLQSGIVETTANLNETSVVSVNNSEIINNRYYRIIQFKDIPTEATKANLEASGFRLLDYLPNYAWFVSIDRNADLKLLNSFGARSIIPVEAEMKKPQLNDISNIPTIARKGKNNLLVNLNFYADVTKEIAINTLSINGFEIVDFGKNDPTIKVLVSINDLDRLASLSSVYFISPDEGDPVPDDTEGRSLHRSSAINTDYGAGRHYDGTGVVMAIADDGTITPHIDFTGRLTQNTTTNSGTHGDMTSGIAVGAGNRDPKITGAATGAYLQLYYINNYPHIVNAVSNLATLGTVITSTSYSEGTGGVYTTNSSFIDNQIRTNPSLLHIFSAGNAGTSSGGSGYPTGWGNITGGYKAGKSVIASGNLNNKDVLENSSSRGPAADGRIKPDLCANGYNQLSTNAPNGNQVGGGTSAASPSIGGCTAQLYHAYKTLNGGSNPEGALIKAAMLNTAEDLGNAGPDFKHGWGRINALRAVKTLENNTYLSSTVANGGTNNHTITIPAGVSQVRVMVYWADYEGSPAASKAIVNNLDIRMQAPGGIWYNPWILDPTKNAVNLNLNAVRGVDTLNPVEQVTLDSPVAGSYTVEVNGTLVPNGPQKYWLVYEFRKDEIEVTYPIGGEGFAPAETQTLRWDAHGTSGNFTIAYSTNNGSTYTTITTTASGAARFYDWVVPSVVSGQCLIRITRSTATGTSASNFTIVGVPTGLAVDWACPDSLRLIWNAVSGATGYEIFKLGTKYMDVIGTSNNTTFVGTGIPSTATNWFSVRALTTNNGAGRRAVAITKAPGTFNCPQVCINPPTPGTTIANTNVVCQGSGVNLSLSGNTIGTGQTYQWQYSTGNGTWSDISGATIELLTVYPISDTYYRCALTCGATAVSDSILIDVFAGPCNYCTAGGNTCDEYIGSVTFGSISNLGTGCTGYTNYTLTHSTNLTAGTPYSITVVNPVTYTGDQCTAWVDWNQDEDFDDAGETFTLSGGPGTFTGSITAPLTAMNGQTRLRIRMNYTGSMLPCGNTQYGEVEDYAVIIVGGACANPPVLSLLGSDPDCNISGNGIVTSSISAGTPPYTYLWDNGATTSSISGLSDGVYLLTVTDANSCTANASINYTETPVMNLNPASTNLSCYVVCNGTASVSPTGGINTGDPLGYSYLWNGGATVSSLSGLCAGNYSVTVTSSSGCSAIANFSITQPTVLTVNTSSGNASCASNCDGNASAIGVGGTAPYTYLWNSGATTGSLSNLCVGNYTVVVTDSKGCTANAGVNITGPACLSCTKPDQLSTTNINATNAKLNWNPNVTGDAFLLRYWEGNSYNYLYAKENGPAPATSTTIYNLAPSTTYSWQVKTQCASGNSVYSSIASFTTPSGAIACSVTPQNLGHNSITATKVNLTWEAQSAENFKIRYRLISSPDWVWVTFQSLPNNGNVLQGLSPTTTYVWQLRTTCLSGGNSAFSATDTFTTGSGTLLCTSTPINMGESNVQTNSVYLNWAAQNADNFKVRYRLINSGIWTWATFQNPPNNGGLLTNLSPATSYVWQLRTTCSGVNSAFSNVDTFTTLAQPVRIAENLIHAGVHPNPFKEEITIFWNDMESKSRSAIEFRLFDMIGAEKLKGEFIGNSTSVDLKELPPGIYILKLNRDTKSQHIRIVKN